MAQDVFDSISKVSTILGFWTLLGITTFLILCCRRIYYVYRLPDARREARGRIWSIRDEIRSLRDDHPNIDGAISQALHNSILDRERRLGILSQTEFSLWISLSAFFRADPCLQLLGGLEQDLRQSVQRMTEVRETRLIILSTCNARQADAALPTTADISNPRPCEASAALQPAESGSRAFSSGHSTTIEPMGTEAGNLRRRVTSPHVVFVNTDVNLQKLEEIIKASAWLRNNELEPCIGDPDCPAEADPHGIRGLSVYTAFVNRQNGDAYGCKYARCSAYSVRCMEEAVRHQRIHHFDHSPYLCLASTWNACYRRFPSQVDLNSHQQNCPW